MLILHSRDFTACWKHSSQTFCSISTWRCHHAVAATIPEVRTGLKLILLQRECQKIHRRGQWLQESLSAAADAESLCALESLKYRSILGFLTQRGHGLSGKDTRTCATPVYTQQANPACLWIKNICNISCKVNFYLLSLLLMSNAQAGKQSRAKFEKAESSTLSNPSDS